MSINRRATDRHDSDRGKGYNEREITALDMTDIDPSLVCLDVLCVASDDSPHMKTRECPTREGG